MRRDRISKRFGCHWLFISMHLHQCISYRYDDGSTDRSKGDWKSEDGVRVFSPGDDAMGLLSS